MSPPGARSGRASDDALPERQRRIGFEARLDSIARAAREVFAESGYASASMREIAERAGITKSSLYEYFDSKKALHLWLLDREREELNALGFEVMSGKGSAEQRVERTFSAFFRYIESNPYAWRMLFRETTGDPEIAAAHRDIHAEASAAIARMLLGAAETTYATGKREQELASAVGELVRGGLHGISLWWREHPEVSHDALVALCMDLYWSGLDRLLRGRAWSARRVRPAGS